MKEIKERMARYTEYNIPLFKRKKKEKAPALCRPLVVGAAWAGAARDFWEGGERDEETDWGGAQGADRRENRRGRASAGSPGVAAAAAAALTGLSIGREEEEGKETEKEKEKPREGVQMATSKRGIRSTRKLRDWTVEQVESGKFPGLVWDDPPAKTMFRIPWKHAGKHEFRQDEDAGFFKAWAIYKGKYNPGESNPATWKTRVRCALSKSPEFEEVQSRSRLDITEPYKVYRLVPILEQVLGKKAKLRKTKQERTGDASSPEASASPREVIQPPADSLLQLQRVRGEDGTG
ncbi:interferon regulatory factor 9 [Crotalus adamanteus]|uniref:Interferon regulatory factor 9 n=1 Tax=Crotalus adamanteus TaxID=8729 RepID=A0AAW1B901_CROAD